jgi:uncharacterized phiE125 gp8 family phage protein
MWMNNCWGYGYPYALEPLRASVIIASAAENEVVSLAAMRNILKVPINDNTQDDRIVSYIQSARVHAERHTKRSLTKKRYMMSLSRFPNYWSERTNKINLWYPPLIGDVSVKYIDLDGNSQTLTSGQHFQVDFVGEPGRIAPLPSQSWPLTKYGVMNGVQIFYTAGYEVNSSERFAADAEQTDVIEPEINSVDVMEAGQVSSVEVDRTLPNDLFNAITQLIGHWFLNRVPIVTIAGAGGAHLVLPWHIEKVLDDCTFDTLTPTTTPEY